MFQHLLAFLREKRNSVYLPIEIVYAFLAITAAVSPLKPEALATSLFWRNSIATALVAILIYHTQSFADFLKMDASEKLDHRSNVFQYLGFQVLFNGLLFLVIGGLFAAFIFGEDLQHFRQALAGFGAINIFVMLLNIISTYVFQPHHFRLGFFALAVIPAMMLPILFGALTQAHDITFAAFIPPHTNLLWLPESGTFSLVIHSVLFIALFGIAIWLHYKNNRLSN